MNPFLDHPPLIFAASLLMLWFCAWFGAAVLRRRGDLDAGLREDFSLILTSSLTLLGLIIGFSFSMAISRYDVRKTYEEAEANAIGTEYVRVDFMQTADAAKLKALLRRYTVERILFYTTDDSRELPRIVAQCAALQNDLWSAVRGPAALQPNPVMALVISGMNDVLNSQGYTQAAWWNRIPLGAWTLMALIATLCNLLIGYGARKLASSSPMLWVLPLVVAISFFLIADIDSPRGGLIRVVPQNLNALLTTLPAAADVLRD